MKSLLTVSALVVAVVGASAPAMAKNNGNGPPDHAKEAKECPPGLAKKTPRCVPPGLAKVKYERYNGEERIGDYHRGDQLPDWLDRINNPSDYGLEVIVNGSDYYEHDGVVYRVNSETRQVLDLFRAVDNILD